MITYIEIVDKKHIVIHSFSTGETVAKNLHFKKAEEANAEIAAFLEKYECKQIAPECWVFEGNL